MSIRVPKESGVLRDVLEYLRLAGITHYRNNTGAARYGKRLVRFGVAGMPDVVGILPSGVAADGQEVQPGRFLGCEVKAEDGRLSQLQRACLDNIAAAGGLALVVRSVDDLRAALRAEGYEVP